MKTDKELEKAEFELKLTMILAMRFGDGTGQDLQVKLAKKEIMALFHSYALGIIGKDSKKYKEKNVIDCCENIIIDAQNSCRAEQRKRI